MPGTASNAASVEGTRRYAQRAIGAGASASAYRALGRTELVTSSLGFGSYRIDDRTSEHAAALESALLSGVNLIDTSTNYTDGSSETCIGNVLVRHRREEVIVVSKVGYVQGQALAMARAREQRGAAFPEMVKYTDRCWHCIHPEFLADQLERSLGRLRVDNVDVYLLHNPEYFFTDAAKRRKGASLETLQGEFYDRIRRAFSHLEDEVRRGRIGFYGVSSNTFGAAASDPEATSLARMWMIAGEVAHKHHFAVAQLPANIFESGPMLTRNNVTGTRTALEFAREQNLAVLVNRPLNAFYREQLIRLADASVRSIAGTREIHTRVDPFLPPAYRTESLSRKALAVLTNTKGVTCVLNGMRHPNYVDDSLGVLRSPPFDVDLHLYEAFNQM
jgi:aryl-alcohol dehydrogenase-like predicted oxidoreductase